VNLGLSFLHSLLSIILHLSFHHCESCLITMAVMFIAIFSFFVSAYLTESTLANLLFDGLP